MMWLWGFCYERGYPVEVETKGGQVHWNGKIGKDIGSFCSFWGSSYVQQKEQYS